MLSWIGKLYQERLGSEQSFGKPESARVTALSACDSTSSVANLF